MAQLSPEQIAKLRKKLPPGVYVSRVCDSCSRPIISTLTYITTDGHETCSRTCKDQLEESNHPRRSKVKEEKTSKNAEAAPDKKKKTKAEAAPEAKPSKKDKKAKAQPEEPPKKHKKGADKKKGKKDADKASKKPAEAKSSDKADKPAKKSKGNGERTTPFREGSKLQEAFEMATAGTTKDKLEKFIAKNDLNRQRIFTFLRKGAKKPVKGFRWDLKENDEGKFKILNVRTK